ncbi:hypothetical protein AMK59_384, partial [Oryctes borbonicus]
WRFPLGQNFGRGQKVEYDVNDANWTAIIEYWFNENKKYKFGKIGFDYQTSGHYTQLIWADTEYIGCGFNSHSNGDEESVYEVEEIYVCHYGPRGNLLGRFPYESAPKNVIRSDNAEDYLYY